MLLLSRLLGLIWLSLSQFGVRKGSIGKITHGIRGIIENIAESTFVFHVQGPSDVSRRKIQAHISRRRCRFLQWSVEMYAARMTNLKNKSETESIRFIHETSVIENIRVSISNINDG